MLTSLLMVVFLGMAIKMVLHWRKSDEDNQRLLKDKAELELKFLKTQLRPHFLFNTLNNLYYLSLEKSEKAPRAVLALSELLDYVLHETHATFVPVETELKQLQNYIALESFRYDDRLEVHINVSPLARQRRIVPMLLITLLENSFKHGVSKTTQQAWIHLDITSDPEKTIIRVKNSTTAATATGGDGVGLTSIRGQLSMLYRDRATLEVFTERNSFEVKLELTEAG
jgi:LytS/YehU family sensor histidine kinase